MPLARPRRRAPATRRRGAAPEQRGPGNRGDGPPGVEVTPGAKDILDQPDRRGQRPPGGRAIAYLLVSGQLEDSDEGGQCIRRGASQENRADLIPPGPFI